MQPALLLRRGEHCHRDSRSQAGGLSANTRLQRTLPAAGDFLRPPERSWAALAGGVAQCPSTTPPTHSMQWQGEDFSSLGCVIPPAVSQRQRKISPGTSACSELTAEQRGLWHSQPQPPQLNPALATTLHKHYGATSPHRKLPAPCYTSNCSALALKEQKKKGIQQLLLHVSLTGLCAGLCCSIRVLGAPGSVPPCQVEGLQAKAQVVGVGEATGRLLRGCGEKHPACHCFFRVLEVCSD